VKRRRRDFVCFDGWVLVLPPSLLDRRYKTCMQPIAFAEPSFSLLRQQVVLFQQPLALDQPLHSLLRTLPVLRSHPTDPELHLV
jgi:hypothetical protein